MKRNEIADKYKWKLEDMVPSDQEWENSTIVLPHPKKR